jgi:ABC-type glycerol-3-phosphate transport system substrate-binding protein
MIRRGLLLLAVLALTACGGGGGGAPEASSPASAAGGLTDIESVLDLRAAFNADSGRPRLLLLLSPT